MQWVELKRPYSNHGATLFDGSGVFTSRCNACLKRAIWLEDSRTMFWPADFSNAPLPHQDMPDDVLPDYLEARSIVSSSPRGAAALLRLAVQKLCKRLGEPGKNINDDIKQLVKKGLPVEIQQALDIVRVTGNNAVHPGEMTLDDGASVAGSLFGLINLIVDNRIAQPAKIKAIYEALPSGALKAVEERDKQ